MPTPPKTVDVALRLWASVELVYREFKKHKVELGKLFRQLREVYSQRSAGLRLSSGSPGTFEYEIRKRGFKPNRVREWINDYEVSEGLRPPAESTSNKRAARRSRTTSSAEYTRGFIDGSTFFGPAQNSDWASFAKLLSHAEARSAFRAAAKRLHPDHGGNAEKMRALNLLWEKLEPLYLATDRNSPGASVSDSKETIAHYSVEETIQ